MSGIVIQCYFRTEFKEAEKSKTQLNTANQNLSNYTVVKCTLAIMSVSFHENYGLFTPAVLRY